MWSGGGGQLITALLGAPDRAKASAADELGDPALKRPSGDVHHGDELLDRRRILVLLDRAEDRLAQPGIDLSSHRSMMARITRIAPVCIK